MHAREHSVFAKECARHAFCAVQLEDVRVVNNPGNKGCFCRTQVDGVFAKMALRRRLDTVRAAEVHKLEIQCKNFLLGQRVLNVNGKHHLTCFAQIAFLGCEVEVFRKLHGDGRRAGFYASANGVADHCTHNRVRVDAAMLVEARVFRSEHCVHNRRLCKLLGERRRDAILGCKAAELITLGIVDARRHRQGARAQCVRIDCRESERARKEPCPYVKRIEHLCDAGRSGAVQERGCRGEGNVQYQNESDTQQAVSGVDECSATRGGLVHECLLKYVSKKNERTNLSLACVSKKATDMPPVNTTYSIDVCPSFQYSCVHMHTFIEKLKVIVHDKALRNRIFFVLGAIALFRIFAQIPIPGANHAAVAEFFATNQFFGLFNVFSGGGLTTLSIMMLCVGPYITASIIMQLMTVISPKLKEMHSEECEAGRAKFTQYSRLIALPLATLQGFGFLTLLKSQGVLLISTPQQFVMNLVIVVAGAMRLLWIGELVTEFGIGNGISIIIFAGIVASLPQTYSQVAVTATKAQIPLYVGFALIAAMAIYAIVVMTQAERKIPTTHARQATAGNAYGSTGSYIPLRLNQAGVIPIIFALSLLTFPQIVAAMLGYVSKPEYQAIAQKVIAFLADQTVYGVLYFVLVLFFTYFYTAITFEPEKMSKNLQRSGAFIPGIRPGVETTTYLGTVVTRRSEEHTSE